MTRTSAHWLLLVVALLLSTQAAAYNGSVTYQGQKTPDLFPDDDRFEVRLTPSATATWALPTTTLTPGGTAGTALSASAGQFSILVDYDFHPLCCPNAAVTGSKTLTAPTPLGCKDLTYPDNGWSVTVTLCGTITATPRAESGSVTPASLSWSSWPGASQNLLLTPNSGASTVTVTIPTAYALTATVTVSGYGLSRSSDPRTLDSIVGTPDVREAYPVAQPPAAPPPPAPAPAPPPAAPPPATPPAAPPPATPPATPPNPAPSPSPPVQPSPSPPPPTPPAVAPPSNATPALDVLVFVAAVVLVAAARRQA